jgi:hypothetical protein
MTPSPAETSLRLMQDASLRLQQAQVNISTAVQGVSRQFQANYEAIKATQNMSPQVAQALYMARNPNYTSQDLARNPFGVPSESMLPSPLMMTPSETGVFRPRAPSPGFGALPPMGIPSFSNRMLSPIGLGYSLPQPMFQSPAEQQQTFGDMSSMNAYAAASKIPGVMGQGIGFGAAAMAGAKLGGAFGPWGRAIGAGVGMLGAGLAGIPSAVGGMADMVTGIPMETIRMGADIQNATRGFVTSGAGLSPTGRGLTREASRELASGIRDMAADSSNTSGMNKADMMNILKQGGQAGLFDMAQSVPDIKNKLRETANTIKEFMQLTNDPSLTSVIQQMGQMQQMGMTQAQMSQAAQGMRAYSRQAGTSIQGLKEIGGLPGAATFQGAGLTAGAGFQYGNFAAGMTRQMVAGGNMSAQQLALLGGVSGMTQRDIQAQAAFSSMPLYAAKSGRFGAKGWTAAADGASDYMAAGGAQGMVTDAYRNLSAGVAKGGIGALAMFQLQGREVADSATSKKTPGELMAERYMMALNTGKQLGMGGIEGFATGAQIMFGRDQGEQMIHMMKSGGLGQLQRSSFDQMQDLAGMQRSAMGNRPLLPASFTGGIGGALSKAIEYPSNAMGRGIDNIGNFLADFPLIGGPESGMVRRRRSYNDSINTESTRRYAGSAAGTRTRIGSGKGANTAGTLSTDPDTFINELANSMSGMDPSDTGKAAKRLNVSGAALQVAAVSVAKKLESRGGSLWSSLTSGEAWNLESPQVKEELDKAAKSIPGYANKTDEEKAEIMKLLLLEASQRPGAKRALAAGMSDAAGDFEEKQKEAVDRVLKSNKAKMAKLQSDAGISTGIWRDDVGERLMGFIGDNPVGGKTQVEIMGIAEGATPALYKAWTGAGGKGTIDDFAEAIRKAQTGSFKGVLSDDDLREGLGELAKTPAAYGQLQDLALSNKLTTAIFSQAGMQQLSSKMKVGALRNPEAYTSFREILEKYDPSKFGDKEEKYRQAAIDIHGEGPKAEEAAALLGRYTTERLTSQMRQDTETAPATGAAAKRVKRDDTAFANLAANLPEKVFSNAVDSFGTAVKDLKQLITEELGH